MSLPASSMNLNDRLKKVIRLFSAYSFGRILDIGCGDGEFSMTLKRSCGATEVYGLEAFSERVALARAKGVRVFDVDFNKDPFPFEDGFFDATFAGEVLEHVVDPTAFIAEIHRTLKTRGILVLTTPNLAAIHNRVALLLGYQPFPTWGAGKLTGGDAWEEVVRPYKVGFADRDLGHIRVLTLRSLLRLLRDGAFDVLRVEGASAGVSRNTKLLKLMSGMDRFFSHFPSLSYRTIVVCSKRA